MKNHHWGDPCCPTCGEDLQFMLSYPGGRLAEMLIDAVHRDLSVCPKDNLMWIHEHGGYEGRNSWFGPVPAHEGEIATLTASSSASS